MQESLFAPLTEVPLTYRLQEDLGVLKSHSHAAPMGRGYPDRLLQYYGGQWIFGVIYGLYQDWETRFDYPLHQYMEESFPEWRASGKFFCECHKILLNFWTGDAKRNNKIPHDL